MIGIYKITNRKNGKIYIGQSINIKKRFQEHKNCKENRPLYKAFKKYGINNFDFEVICECEKKDLDKLEKQYIRKYKSNISGIGYNLTKGGTNIFAIQKKLNDMPKEDFKKWHKKIGAKHKGKIVSQEQKEKISKTLKEYFKDENNRKRLSEQRKGKTLSSSTRLKMSMVQQESMKQYAKKVLQYDLNNNLIAEYESLQDVGRKTGFKVGGISKCCLGKGNTAYGFKWKYDEEFNKQFRKSIKRIIKPKQLLKGQPTEVPKRWKKVYQYDECYNLIKVFDSFKQVAQEFGEYKNVSAVCRGQREHAYGYRWSYTLINKENNHED
jgi:group I intron endonuclease